MKNFIIISSILSLLYAVVENKSAVASEYILPDKIEVITADHQPLQHVKHIHNLFNQKGKSLKIYNINDVTKFKQTLNTKLKLPANKEKAKQMVFDYIETIGRQRFNQQLITAYQGLLLAFKYKIDRFPAIVFDEREVIYGVTDLKLALQKYHNWQYLRLNQNGDRHE